MKNLQKNSLYKPFSAKIMLVCIVMLMAISMVSALQFDNVKAIKNTYGKAGYKDIEIINSFGFGKKLWSGTLDYNTKICGESCQAIQTITLHEKGSLVDEVLFERIYEDGSRKQTNIRNYKVLIKTGQQPYEVDDYKTQCSKKFNSKNNSYYQDCKKVKVGTHIEYNKIWKEYELGTELEAGTYEVKLEGEKKPSWSVDWIYKTQGETLDEWAVWGGSISTLNNGLVSYYSFNETSGVVVDELGLNNGSNLGATRGVPGKIGNGFDFESSENDYVTFSDSASLDISGDGSFCAWIKLETSTDGNVLQKGYDGTKLSYRLLDLSDPTNTGGYYDGTNWDHYSYSNTNFNTGTWYHVCMIVDTSVSKILFFKNGINVVNGTIAGSGIPTNNKNVTIGVHDNNGALDHYFDGIIDEIGIWNRSLTSSEVSGLYNSGNGIDYATISSEGAIALNSPDDNYVSSLSEIQFNATATITGTTLTNMSLWHNGTGTWHRNQTKTITGTENTTTFNSTFSDGSYLWGIEACDSDGDCGFSENRTVGVDTTAPIIDIEAPSGTLNYGAVGSSETLNVTFTDANLDSCWYNYNGTNITIEGCQSGIKNSTTFILEPNNFNMTIYANDSVGHINSSFISWGYSFFEDSSFVESEIFETENQTIRLNITSTETILQINAILNYDNVNYTGTARCSGQICSIYKTFDTPLVSSGESQNKSFYWKLNLFNGTSSKELITNVNNQTVNRIHLEKCNATYPTKSLNFTAYDENNLTRIDPYEFSGFFEYWLGSGTVKRNISIEDTSSSELTMCLSPTNETFQTDTQITYGFSDENTTYVDRDYYLYNYSINNATQDIYLYLLNAEDSTTFIQKVEDQITDAVPGAYIHTLRWYPGEGIYRTVAISKTDDNGKATGFYVVETVDYKHIIYLDSENVLETNKGKIIPEEVPYTLIFKIGEGVSSDFKGFEETEGLTTLLNFNETTNITTFSWIDTTSTVVLGRLLVYKINYDTEDTLICNESQIFSSATVTCDLSGYNGSFIAYGYIQPSSSSTEELKEVLDILISNAREIFGNTGIIIGWFIILTVALALIWNPTAMIVGINVSTIFVNLIGFIDFGMTYIFSMVSISILAIIFMKT